MLTLTVDEDLLDDGFAACGFAAFVAALEPNCMDALRISYGVEGSENLLLFARLKRAAIKRVNRRIAAYAKGMIVPFATVHEKTGLPFVCCSGLSRSILLQSHSMERQIPLSQKFVEIGFEESEGQNFASAMANVIQGYFQTNSATGDPDLIEPSPLLLNKIPITGLSASLTVVMHLLWREQRRWPTEPILITGEVTAAGDVKPVDFILQKAFAAQAAGFRAFVYPVAELRDSEVEFARDCSNSQFEVIPVEAEHVDDFMHKLEEQLSEIGIRVDTSLGRRSPLATLSKYALSAMSIAISVWLMAKLTTSEFSPNAKAPEAVSVTGSTQFDSKSALLTVAKEYGVSEIELESIIVRFGSEGTASLKVVEQLNLNGKHAEVVAIGQYLLLRQQHSVKNQLEESIVDIWRLSLEAAAQDVSKLAEQELRFARAERYASFGQSVIEHLNLSQPSNGSSDRSRIRAEFVLKTIKVLKSAVDEVAGIRARIERCIRLLDEYKNLKDWSLEDKTTLACEKGSLRLWLSRFSSLSIAKTQLRDVENEIETALAADSSSNPSLRRKLMTLLSRILNARSTLEGEVPAIEMLGRAVRLAELTESERQLAEPDAIRDAMFARCNALVLLSDRKFSEDSVDFAKEACDSLREHFLIEFREDSKREDYPQLVSLYFRARVCTFGDEDTKYSIWIDDPVFQEFSRVGFDHVSQRYLALFSRRYLHGFGPTQIANIRQLIDALDTRIEVHTPIDSPRYNAEFRSIRLRYEYEILRAQRRLHQFFGQGYSLKEDLDRLGSLRLMKDIVRSLTAGPNEVPKHVLAECNLMVAEFSSEPEYPRAALGLLADSTDPTLYSIAKRLVEEMDKTK